MRVLYIDYATWKSVVQTNSFAVYEQVKGTNVRHVWAGTQDIIYRSDVETTNYADYDAAFPTRTEVAGEDTALANITGLSGSLAAQSVSIEGVTPAADGRLVVRQTVAGAGRQRLRAFTFYTADPSKLVNRDHDWTDIADVVQKEYDAAGDEITEAPYAGSVKTTLDFEPTYDYEIIGGEVDIPSDIQGGVTDEWFAACVGVPDVPSAQGGNVPFVSCVNMEAFDGSLDIDGRATTFLPYNATYHTNKVRFVFLHPAGVSKRFQIFVETFA